MFSPIKNMKFLVTFETVSNLFILDPFLSSAKWSLDDLSYLVVHLQQYYYSDQILQINIIFKKVMFYSLHYIPWFIPGILTASANANSKPSLMTISPLDPTTKSSYRLLKSIWSGFKRSIIIRNKNLTPSKFILRTINLPEISFKLRKKKERKKMI